MAKHRKHAKLNIPFCAGLILLCLTLFSTHFTSGLYAKYVAKDSAEDSARVAKFDVVVTPANRELEDIVLVTIATKNDESTQYDEMQDDVSSYVITIENNSEVAVHYELSLDDFAYTGITPLFLKDSKEIESGDLAPNSTDNVTLSFSVNWDKFTENLKGSSISKELDFKVIIKVTQID